MDIIDLRSDFLAHATPAMRAAGNAAEHSHHFGLREDPWQRKLEARVAELLGMQDALVFPTCTMANTTALMLGATPGSCVVTQQGAHVLVSEAGAGAALGGLLMSAVDAPGPMPPIAAWERALGTPGDAQRPPARLCVLENTHNRGGGVALPADYVEAVVAVARNYGTRLHLDGARLFNAACALDVAPAALASGFDTASVSLNKGFGAPIAAVLAGSNASIERALVLRQRLGGGLRPIGPAAAATLAGLTDFSHIAKTHELAQRLAAGLAAVTGLDVDEPPRRTNIVIVRARPPHAAIALCGRFAARGLQALPLESDRIRFVTYRDITATDIDRALDIVGGVMRAG
ncbi:MAG: low specificity L-threonine aldolase [Betaproteobacteria bacterium]|nr:low specificity L-threonine aldolase [Betaproteobacteria bacterium]